MTSANPQPATPVASGQTSASAADAGKTGKEPSADSAAARQSLTFPLILTVLAILPVALGIGVVRLKASAAAMAHSQKSDESEDLQAKAEPQLQRADRRIGDREFLARRYEVALRYFQKLGTDDPTRQLPELQYRIALCQEGLGLWDEALTNMQFVSRSSLEPNLKAAAIFGQARLFVRRNELKNAESLLRSLELQANRQSPLPQTIQREIDFLLPLTLAHQTVAGGIPGFDDAVPPMGEILIWSLETALGWADVQEPAVDSTPDADLPVNSFQCQVEKLPARVADIPLIIGGTVALRCENQSLKSIAERVAAQCAWQIDWSDLGKDSSLERPVSLSFEGRPISLVLTILASELRSTWSLDVDRLKFQRADPNSDRARLMMDQTLASLQDWMPIHRFCESATFLRGLIAHRNGEQERAIPLYLTLVGRESTPVAIRAAFNLASIYTQKGDFARAGFQLHYVVDGAPGHRLHTVSLIQLGRLLLDSGEPQDAAFQFRRATEAVNRQYDQGRAAVLLGMAYIVQEKYQEAAEVILNFKPLIDEPEVRNAAAFVTSFARWFSISEEMREREAVFMYRSLIALQTNSEWLGQTGQLMIGRAFAELGFDDQASSVYQVSLKGLLTDAARAEMTFALAELDYENDRPESAKELWKQLIKGTSDAWANRARLKLAAIALNEGRASECVDLCDQVVAYEGINRRELWRTMGRAYEAMGNDSVAAQCYAGQPPKK